MNGADDALDRPVPADGSNEGDGESGVYLSISDLMSGLLFVFMLIVVVFVHQLMLREDEVRAQEERIRQLDEQLARVVQQRRVLVGELIAAFRIRNIDVQVDPETGDVTIREDVLFDFGSYELRREAPAFLDRFVPAYAQVIFSRPELAEQVTRVVVEGHTSAAGEPLRNLRLSLNRSLAVSRYVFSEGPAFPERERLRGRLLAAGRGEEEADQGRDRPEDRRVLFRFQFRSDEVLTYLEEFRRATEARDEGPAASPLAPARPLP